jgi:hypothetical protein
MPNPIARPILPTRHTLAVEAAVDELATVCVAGLEPEGPCGRDVRYSRAVPARRACLRSVIELARPRAGGWRVPMG